MKTVRITLKSKHDKDIQVPAHLTGRALVLVVQAGKAFLEQQDRADTQSRRQPPTPPNAPAMNAPNVMYPGRDAIHKGRWVTGENGHARLSARCGGTQKGQAQKAAGVVTCGKCLR